MENNKNLPTVTANTTASNPKENKAAQARLKPISPWGYIGYQLLYCIPLIGLIVLLAHAIDARNQNVKNYARSVLIVIIISLVLMIFMIVMCAVLISTNPEIYDYIMEYFEQNNVTFN